MLEIIFDFKIKRKKKIKDLIPQCRVELDKHTWEKKLLRDFPKQKVLK